MSFNLSSKVCPDAFSSWLTDRCSITHAPLVFKTNHTLHSLLSCRVYMQNDNNKRLTALAADHQSKFLSHPISPLLRESYSITLYAARRLFRNPDFSIFAYTETSFCRT